MPVFAKRLLVILLVLLLLAGLLFAAAPALLAWLAERQVSASTGRGFAIDGPLAIDWGWSPTVTVPSPRLANASWAEPAAMFEAEQVSVQLDLRALLRGRVRIQRLEVDAPQLHLMRDAQGRVNWDFPREDQPDREPPQIEAVRVSDGRVSYRDAVEGARVDARLVARAPVQEANGGIVLEAEGEASGEPFRLRLQGSAPLTQLLDAEQAYPLRVKMQAGEARLAARGQVAPALRDLGLDIDLALSGPDLGAVLGLFGLRAPHTPAFRLQAMLRGAAPRWEVLELQAGLGASDLSGELTFDIAGAVPTLRGELRSQRLDLRDAEGLIGQRPREPDPALLPDTPIPVDMLRAAGADLTLQVREVKLPGLPVDAVQGRLRLAGGELRLAPLRLALADGAVEGRVLLDGADDRPRLNMDLALRDLRLERFFPDQGVGDSSHGGINGQLVYEGAGPTVAALVENSAGSLTAFMNEGRLDILVVELLGLDVAEAVGVLVGADEQSPNMIRCAAAALVMEEGVLRPEPLVVDTEDSVIVASGYVDLGREQMELHLEAHPKDASILAARTPVTLSGAIRDPQIEIGGGLAARVSVALALSALAGPFAAVLPFIEPGLAEDSPCGELFERARQAGPSGDAGG